MVRVKIGRQLTHHLPEVLGWHHRKNHIAPFGYLAQIMYSRNVGMYLIAPVFFFVLDMPHHLFVSSVEQNVAVLCQQVCDHRSKVSGTDYAYGFLR